MADIGPIADSYVDEVIRSAGVYNPNLNKTQGVHLRELVKLIRDRAEQQTQAAMQGSAFLLDIVYADLVTALVAGSLKPGHLYRITDYQTVHNIINVSPSVASSGPVEALIVLALSESQISEQAWSQQYPQDTIIYTVNNARIPGATKGCILSRHDTDLNVKVCNDFRNVKYRRYKYKPVAYDSAAAYNQYAPVLGTDGAIYFCNKPGGIAAGTGTAPGDANDDWAQLAPNNNYYMSYSNTPTGLFTSNNGGQTYRNVLVPVDANDFLDSVMFPNYGPGFSEIEIMNAPGNMCDMVFFNVGQASILTRFRCGSYTGITAYRSTWVISAGYVTQVDLKRGIYFSLILLSGLYISNWNADLYVYATTANIRNLLYNVNASFYECMIRNTFANAIIKRAEFCIFPFTVRQLYAPYGIGNIKWTGSAEIRGLYLLVEFGSEYLALSVGFAATYSEQYVTVPLFWKTAIGAFANGYNVSSNLALMLEKLKTRHIAYAYEEPVGKTVIIINNAAPKTIAWLTDLTDTNMEPNAANCSGADTLSFPAPSTFKYMTYAIKHGDDFQVQQKDLVSGSWAINRTPSYTIDSLDAHGHVQSVTFSPLAGATESRFIIV